MTTSFRPALAYSGMVKVVLLVRVMEDYSLHVRISELLPDIEFSYVSLQGEECIVLH